MTSPEYRPSRGYPGDHPVFWKSPEEELELALFMMTSPLHPLYHCTSRKARPCRRCGKEIAPRSNWWGTPSIPYCEPCYKAMPAAERLAPFWRWTATGKRATAEEINAFVLEKVKERDAKRRAEWEQGPDGEWRRVATAESTETTKGE